MRYIIRYKSTGRRAPAPKLWTVPADALDVEYKRLSRRTGTIPGLGVITEDAGVSRSQVTLRSHSYDRSSDERTGSQDAAGRDAGLPSYTIRLMDRNQAIRVLTPEAEEVLDSYDREIEEKLREVRDLRRARSAAVEEAWSRAQKVNIEDLEEKADA